VRRRERRVVTPDGYVWFVRRHRARRRPPWARRDRRRGERFHGEEELPAERLPAPRLLGLFASDGYDVAHPTFDWRIEDDRSMTFNAAMAIGAAVAVVALLAWLTVRHVLPWLVPLVVANARPLLAAAAILVVLAAVNQLHRPWYVELRRQGLADAPRRVWRVQGWRRSGRLMGELTAAIREGRIDNRRAVILLADRRR
jgi:hypothetical protein